MKKNDKPIKKPPMVTESVADSICASVAAGGSVMAACKAIPVDYNTWAKALRADPDLAARFHQATLDRADVLADEIIRIADDPSHDANARRVMVDARKWVASKLRPSVYGEHMQVEHSGTIDTGGLSAHDLSRLAETLALERARREAIDVDEKIVD